MLFPLFLYDIPCFNTFLNWWWNSCKFSKKPYKKKSSKQISTLSLQWWTTFTPRDTLQSGLERNITIFWLKLKPINIHHYCQVFLLHKNTYYTWKGGVFHLWPKTNKQLWPQRKAQPSHTFTLSLQNNLLKSRL